MTNKELFEEFIVSYTDKARKLAAIHTTNPDDIDDVVSESISEALRCIHTLKDTDAIKAWYNSILLRTSINYSRKKKRSSLQVTNRSVYIDDFSHLEFEDLISILPEVERQIVKLRFGDKMELQDIAATLNMNENTVKTKLYRSLKKLKLRIIADDSNRTILKPDIRKQPTLTGVAITLVGASLAAIVALNVFPTVAIASYDIPIVGDIVRVVTFNRFEYEYNNYKARVNLPEIQGLLDPELQNRINTEFAEFADDLIRSFEQTAIELDYHTAHMSLLGDYTIRTDNDRVLAIDGYLYSDVNGYELHKYVTVDKRGGTVVELDNLFAPDADYITPISDYLITEMLRRNAEEGAAYVVGDTQFNPFTQIRPNHSFYINDVGRLIICFDKYEVAPGYLGAQEFEIPREVIEDILVSDLINSE